MFKSLRRWMSDHWKVSVTSLSSVWTLFLWMLDAPGRWHELNIWANELRPIRFRFDELVSSGVFLFGATLLVLGNKGRNAANSSEHLQLGQADASALSKMPDIRGDIVAAFRDEAQQCYYLKVRLVNHSEIPCTVWQYILNVSGGNAAFGNTNICGVIEMFTKVGEHEISRVPFSVQPLNPTNSHPLERALEQIGWVEFNVESTDLLGTNVESREETFVLTVVDSLGNKHRVANTSIPVELARFRRGLKDSVVVKV